MKKTFFVLLFFALSGCATMQGQRQKFVNTHSGLTQEQRDAILKGEVIAGMTEDMVVASWGKPIDIVNEVISGVNVNSWIYQHYVDNIINTYRVRFREGLVRDVRLVSSREQRYSPYYRRHYWWGYPEFQ